MSETYTIRPLEWVERGPDDEGLITLECESVVGFYWVGWEPSKKLFVWGLCDELMEKACDSLAAGKAYAEAHYRSRLLPALTATKGATHEK